MNRAPLHPITQADIDAYDRDGVVCLRQMFDRDWIERLLRAWERVKRQTQELGAEKLIPRRFIDADPLLRGEIDDLLTSATVSERYRTGAEINTAKYMHFWDDDFRAFALESPTAEIVGTLLQCNEVRFYWDQIFQKRPGGTLETYWHTDQATWPTRGEHLPSVWLPLTPISEEQSLEYIAGSHRDRTEYWGKSWNATQADAAGTRPPNRPDFIDFETRRNDPNVCFLKWAMEPGDVMVFHPRVFHGGGPNRNPDRERIALSTRWFGDDIVWNPRVGDVNVPGMPHHMMTPGARPDDDELFPVVWRRDAAGARRPTAVA